MKETITHSRMTCLARCPRQHYYNYECMLSPIKEPEPFRFGRIYHIGLEALALRGLEAAVAEVRVNYAEVPRWADPFDWEVECEKVVRLLCGYSWYWQNDGIEVVKTEQRFIVPVVNPETGSATPVFDRAGKMDKKVKLPDGRIALMEHKTTSDDIAPSSDYWAVLRLDPQISGYFTADPELQTIIYDATHKPKTEPRQVKTVNAMHKAAFVQSGEWFGEKITDVDHSALPFRESVQMYGARLAADIAENPQSFYSRQEVPRTEADADEYLSDLWQQQQLLRYRQKNGLWPRNPSNDTCRYCQYNGLCFAGNYPIADVPDGFRKRTVMHEELVEEKQ